MATSHLEKRHEAADSVDLARQHLLRVALRQFRVERHDAPEVEVAALADLAIPAGVERRPSVLVIWNAARVSIPLGPPLAVHDASPVQ